jgi:anti-sigma B factor antagonist
MERLVSNDYSISKTYLDILNQQSVKVSNSTKMLLEISEIKTKASEVKLDFLDKNYLDNLVNEIKVPVSTIMGIILLLKEEYNKRFEKVIVTGFNVIYSDSKRILSILDIIHECSLNENNEIQFYKNVLTGIFEEKEKLKKYPKESTTIDPAINQIIQNDLISQKVRETKEENPTLITLPEIKINYESSFFSFKRDNSLLFEKKNFYDLTIVFINANRATLKNATDFKNFIIDTLKSSSRNYVIDLSVCDYIDSTFVGVLVFFKKEMDKNNGNIVLVLNRNNFVLESFALLNLELLFEIYPDLTSALIDLK